MNTTSTTNPKHSTPSLNQDLFTSADLEAFSQDVSGSEVEFPPVHALKTDEKPRDGSAFEVHHHHNPHDHSHVDLMKDEYLPDEVARMLGTSLEVVMHAIWRGELKAERKGRHVVCIPRAALLDWYKIRG